VSYEKPAHDSRANYEQELIMPEASEAIKSTFIEIAETDPIIIACGDDRGITHESMKYLISQGLPAESAFGRIFGGLYGIANTLLIGIAVQHGPAAMRREMNGSFTHYAHELAAAAKEHKIYLVTHSSVTAEGNPTRLSLASNNPLGCARAEGHGVVNTLATSDPLVFEQARHESISLHGNTASNRHFDKLLHGIKAVTNELGEQPKNYSVSREIIMESGIPAMVVKDDHAPVGQVDHVFSLRTDKIADPDRAITQGTPFYGTDAVQGVRAIIKTKPHLQLDPMLLMDITTYDEVTTRAALAKSTGGHSYDPRLIKSYRYGDPAIAMDYLYSLYG
jgi:hypothetical protein